MKTKAICSFFVLFAIAGGVTALPSAFAAEVSVPEGSGVPGCEDTDECWFPSVVKIGVGETVTWSNDDTAAHTVTSGTAAGGLDGVFDSSLFMAGAEFSHTFDEAGTFEYFCMVHPWMAGTVIVGEAMAEEVMTEEVMIEITTGTAEAGEMLSIDVTFTTISGDSVEHVNYDIKATQNGEVVLNDMGVHDHDGVMNHMTSALPNAASDDTPVQVEVMFNGFGIDPPFTGPIGQVSEKQVVPEFGTIAMMVLTVAIISIVVVTTKSRVIPRF